MLPKIISNITLAFIAIVVIYTFAPIVKDILESIFKPNRPSKKSIGQREFDEMVQRKIERLSQNGGVIGATGNKESKKQQRTFLSYFIEKKMFESEEDEKFYQGLISSMQWGDFPEAQKILKMVSANFSYNEKEAAQFINPLIKNLFNKESLLALSKINKGKLSKEAFIEYAATSFIYEHKDLLKHKLYSSEQLDLLLEYSSLSSNGDKKSKLLEDYITSGRVVFNTKKACLYKSLISNLNQCYDELYPLFPIDKNELRQEFKNHKEESEQKKKYKKMVQIYHPDKWHNKFKSSVIDGRLNEQFNIVQDVYKNL